MSRSRRTSHSRRPPAEEVRLSDPGALRALAHPARLTIVDELYQGRERTASELAELTGLSASAMSYHLRALERFGVVVRAAPRADSRERPWRAAARSLSLSFDDDVGAAAGDVIVAASLEQLRDALRRWSFAEARERTPWREIGRVRRSFLWLTENEATAFAGELNAVLEKYVGDRDAARHPDGTRRVLCMLALVPDAEGPGVGE